MITIIANIDELIPAAIALHGIIIRLLIFILVATNTLIENVELLSKQCGIKMD